MGEEEKGGMEGKRDITHYVLRLNKSNDPRLDVCRDIGQ